jgi:dTDP-4-amino-4,6-dideoxygalactose transaminase
VSVRESFLVFGAPEIGEQEIDEVVDSLRSGWLGTGPKVARFESDFARYAGVDPRQVAAVNSCTAALHLAMLAAGVGPGDEVITSAMTFCATVNSIVHTGATPVVADIEATTLNLDPDDVVRRITPRTRALLPVHFAGRPCDMDRLVAIAKERDLVIIEDCAHAIETEWRGQRAGTFGDFGCYSFYVTKNVVTGEGGMVLGRDADRVSRIRMLALHGMSKDAWHRFSDTGFKHYGVMECGFKYNMMDIQAAIGVHQLARVDENWQRRRAVWNRYQQAFAGLPLGLPHEPVAHTRHAYHLYTVRVSPQRCGLERDRFLDLLQEQNIGAGVHYRALPEHPFYQQHLGWDGRDVPEAVAYGRETVSLPLSAKLTAHDVDDVIQAVGRVLAAA